MGDINKELIDCVDNGFLVHCKNKEEAIDVLLMLERTGYDLDEYSHELLDGSNTYDTCYTNVGCDEGIVSWWADSQTKHQVVTYSDIVRDVYNDCEISEDEFNDMLASLLRE